MTDIIVTVPKSEQRHVIDEKLGEVEVPLIEMDGWENDPTPFWCLGKKPRDLREGDTIHFILNGEIYANATVCAIEEGEEQCSCTGRTWKGCNVFFEPSSVHVLPKDQREKMRGFQGFRYRGG